MARLIAKSPAAGLVPVSLDGITLEEVLPEAITSIAPFKGQAEESQAALNKVGLGFPEPNQTFTSQTLRIIWTGPGQAFLLGPVPRIEGAALTDQSDAWVVLALDGALARDVLSRLTPLDLRTSVFAVDQTARTLLNHMTASITRTGEDRYEIMVFRSMAHTAVHELTEAMTSVVAQNKP